MDQLPAGVPRGPWLRRAQQLEPADLVLPSRADLTAALATLGVDGEDAEELPRLFDEVAAHPLLRWIAQRFLAALRAEAGSLALRASFKDATQAWPLLALSVSPAARCVYLPGFIATAQQVRTAHAARGIPNDTSQATLAEFGRQLRLHRQTYGCVGVEAHPWLMLVWSGGLVDLGRLQGEYVDERTVGLHIPETGPLSPAAVDTSLDRIRREWGNWFEATPARAECESWLLDPALANALPATSNIVGFQQRFTLGEQARVGDDDALYFVFHHRQLPIPSGLTELPRETSLQRAIIDRLADGGHWTVRQGWLAL